MIPDAVKVISLECFPALFVGFKLEVGSVLENNLAVTEAVHFVVMAVFELFFGQDFPKFALLDFDGQLFCFSGRPPSLLCLGEAFINDVFGADFGFP